MREMIMEIYNYNLYDVNKWWSKGQVTLDVPCEVSRIARPHPILFLKVFQSTLAIFKCCSCFSSSCLFFSSHAWVKHQDHRSIEKFILWIHFMTTNHYRENSLKSEESRANKTFLSSAVWALLLLPHLAHIFYYMITW